jgi:replicative DNA helicase
MSKLNYFKSVVDRLEDESLIDAVGYVTERVAGTTIDNEENEEILHITEVSDEETELLSTGYTSLDNLIGGLGNGHVILIGGETSQGKSALATNIAVNVSKKVGVLFITLEMQASELKKRITLANNGSIDGLDIMVQKKFRITYKDVNGIIKNAKELGEVKLVVLDYLQYLGRGMSLQEVSVMSKEIKTLALTHNIPLMVIVSLRKGEGGKAKRNWTDIEIEDFMGTGSIGYDCDTAMIASRKGLGGDYDPEHMYVKILKTRNHALDYNNRYVELNWKATAITEEWKQA